MGRCYLLGWPALRFRRTVCGRGLTEDLGRFSLCSTLRSTGGTGRLVIICRLSWGRGRAIV